MPSASFYRDGSHEARPLQAGTEPPQRRPERVLRNGPSAASAAGTAARGARLSAEDRRLTSRGQRREFAAFLYGTRERSQPDIAHGSSSRSDRGAKSYSYPRTRLPCRRRHASPRWVTVGQLHSHPRAMSSTPGTTTERHQHPVISIVVPGYARGLLTAVMLDVAGVHEFQCGWWHLLTGSARSQRVSFADLRSR